MRLMPLLLSAYTCGNWSIGEVIIFTTVTQLVGIWSQEVWYQNCASKYHLMYYFLWIRIQKEIWKSEVRGRNWRCELGSSMVWFFKNLRNNFFIQTILWPITHRVIFNLDTKGNMVSWTSASTVLPLLQSAVTYCDLKIMWIKQIQW